MVNDLHRTFDVAVGVWMNRLLDQGYCVIPRAIGFTTVAAVDHDLNRHFERTPFCDGDFYGRRTKRFGGLLKRSRAIHGLVGHPLVLAVAERILSPWCDRTNLNLTQAIEIHPGALAQFPHRDQDMWQGIKGETEYLVNVMWPLSRYTADNGATLVWPGSHRRQHQPTLDDDPVAVEMEPGSALLFLGSTLHAGGANRTSTVRRGLIVSYCLGWLKPFENQWLAYPPVVARNFSPEIAALVGYSLHRPNLGNVEGQCPSVLFQDPLADHLAATDALRPEQQALVRQYVIAQERAAEGHLDTDC